MTPNTQTPFQQHDASILETSSGVFIDMPDQASVMWQPDKDQGLLQLTPGRAYAMIWACTWVKAAPLD